MKKIRNKECLCKHCSCSFLAADSKAAACFNCINVIEVVCSCNCGELIKRPFFATKGKVFKQGHGVRGKTYTEIYGKDSSFCGFQRGENNVAKRVEVRNKISKILKEGRHWKFTCPDVIKRRTSRLEEQVKPYLSEWKYQYPVGYYTVDFAQPEKKKVLEVNGCWWHCCSICGTLAVTKKQAGIPLRDKQRLTYLTNHGWTVEFLWEHDIKSWIKTRGIQV